MVYVLLLGGFFISSAFALNQKKIINKKIYLLVNFFAMSLVVGLRGESVGEDTITYLNIAKAASNYSLSEIVRHFPYSTWNVISYGVYGSYNEKIETGYFLLNKLIVSVLGTPQAVLLVCALLTQFFMAKFLLDNAEEKKFLFWGTLIYLCESIFFSQINIMRQSLAMVIALQAINPLKNGKIKKALIWMFLACNIHTSAAAYVILIPLFVIRNRRKMLWIAFIASATLPVTISVARKILPLVGLARYSMYLQVSYWKTSIGGTTIIWMLITLLIGIMLYQKQYEGFNGILISLMMIYISLEIAAISFTALGRIATYFRVFEILFFPRAIECMPSYKSKTCVKLILTVLMLLSFYSYITNPARTYISCFEN